PYANRYTVSHTLYLSSRLISFPFEREPNCLCISPPRSQHGDLGELLRRAVAVLGQPPDRDQASKRPPCANHVEVDVGAVAGDDVVEVFLVCEREGGEVVQPVTLTRLGPVDDAGDFVTVDEDVGDLEVSVHEHRTPRTEHGLGEPAVARDHVGGQDV